MQFIVNLIEYVFSSKKTSIYVTYSLKDYYNVNSLLKAANIDFRVATISDLSSPGSTYSDVRNEYKFYVREKDKGLALKALHRN
ncbi:archaellum component FlaG (FlaF/FlaG flagellin family) [Salirhabdus euzebyi]|uniref:Archaellum component FlaG (FlaF/FlaG flagellin family) n=1 Tax=Salirhabdus euzebyi TaxID=394506 RepID=A0A841Q4N9_9BACI|nr:hypothetical protein [Salirhabdus euzebyi]MBB6453376.1 archaellum component FlaG (FlaF/FlaG flagellin family) [Salirhabdus euzebyi]